MNKLTKAIVATVLGIACCNSAMAAFTLNSTRYIYNEGDKNISFEVTNHSDSTYGGQVWIDNTNQGKDVFLVPQPPFFKVEPKQKQIIRIIGTNDALSKTQESMFWLNVQEIPPKPKKTDGGVLSLAMNTQVKVFYRPTSIKNGRQNAESKVVTVQKGGTTWLKNPTPYYFAIVQVKDNEKDVKLDKKVAYELSQLKPFSEVNLNKKVTGKLSIEAINDWGGVQSYEIR